MNGRPCLKTRPAACVCSTRDGHRAAEAQNCVVGESSEVALRKYEK